MLPVRFKPLRLTALDTSHPLPVRGERFFRFASRETCVIRDEIWMTWMVDLGSRAVIDLPNGRIYDYYIEEPSSLAATKRLEQYILHHWPRHLRQYPGTARRILNSAKVLSAAAGKVGDRALWQKYQQHWKANYAFGEYIWGAWAVIFFTEGKVLRAFPKQMDLIASLDQPIAHLAMLRALHRDPLTEVVAKFAWLNIYNPYDHPYSVADLRRLKRRTSHADLNTQFARMAATRRRYSAFRRTIKDRRLRTSVDLVHAYAFLKTDRMDVWRQVMFALRPFLQSLAARIPGATLRDAANLTSMEIGALLIKKITPSLATLRKRSANHFLAVARRGSFAMTNDARFIRETFQRIKRAELVHRTVRGVTACPGQARGRVRIVAHSSDIVRVKAGEIFVAKYTFPSYTHVMQRCAAIVTDEGGLTSHAAVVAREFGIPCIVGTQVATRLLKTGDRVEVDAIKGIVRKL